MMHATRGWRLAAYVAIAVAAATWILSWWAVPVVAVVAGIVLHARAYAARDTGAGCAAGWLLLLGIDALGGALGSVSRVLGRIMPLPGAALLLVTLLFAALLGWSAAVVGAEARRLASR